MCAKECVSFRLARSERAFGDTIHAVRANTAELANTVPVHASSIVLHAVRDSDTKSVSPAGSDNGPWQLAVDEEALLRTSTIRVARGVGDFKTVRNCFTSCRVLLVKVGGDAVSVAPA